MTTLDIRRLHDACAAKHTPSATRAKEYSTLHAFERLDVTAGDQVAFATALLRCGTKEELAREPTVRLRLTVGLRKEHDRWIIAHEHHSLPYKA
jgi:ketosteroid isomerase-like protein